MKLDLELLAPYSPYDIKVIVGKTIRDLIAMSLTGKYVIVSAYEGSRENQMVGIENIKLILKPLEDIDDEEDNTPEELIRCCWNYTQGLIAEHYDVFGLIPEGLAIDKNTLDDKIEK
jgi:hypothetical protein